MLPWLKDYLTEQQWQAIAERISAAKGLPENGQDRKTKEIHRIAEIKLQPEVAESNQVADVTPEQKVADTDQSSPTAQPWHWWIGVVLLMLIALGFYRGIAQANQLKTR
jgi:hypothetical protein